MSLASQLRTFEARQEAETDLLHQRFLSFADSLNKAPADFIREHPYASTGTVAAAAFLLAQIPLPSRRRRQYYQPPPPAPRPARSRSLFSLTDSLLPMLMGTLQSYLSPHAQPELTAADAGTVASDAFPHNFPSPPSP